MSEPSAPIVVTLSGSRADRRARRGHRFVTVPAGLALFATLGLPAYTDCGGPVVATSAAPFLIVCAVAGLAIAILALFATELSHRAERVVSLLAALGAFVMVGLLICAEIAFAGLVGLHVQLAAAVWLWLGAIGWSVEIRRTATPFRSRWFAGAVVAITLLTVLGASRWAPPPRPPNADGSPDTGSHSDWFSHGVGEFFGALANVK